MARPTNQDIMDAVNDVKIGVIEIKTVVLGKNSDKGLVGWVADIEKMVLKHQRLIYIILGVLGIGGAGAGIASWVI